MHTQSPKIAAPVEQPVGRCSSPLYAAHVSIPPTRPTRMEATRNETGRPVVNEEHATPIRPVWASKSFVTQTKCHLAHARVTKIVRTHPTRPIKRAAPTYCCCCRSTKLLLSRQSFGYRPLRLCFKIYQMAMNVNTMKATR